MSKNYKRTLVTCALPYANGPVHIGHLAGVYVPADIYVRYLRMRGEDVLYVCGSDEHGVPITIKARAQGVSPQDIVDRYHRIIKDSFSGLGINFAIYSHILHKLPLVYEGHEVMIRLIRITDTHIALIFKGHFQLIHQSKCIFLGISIQLRAFLAILHHLNLFYGLV